MARPLGPVVKEIGPEGMVQAPALGRILGLTGNEVKKFTALPGLPGRESGGWIPSTLHNDVRWYDVDLIMRTAMRRPIPLALLQRAVKSNWLKEEVWAADALSLGPWNCCRAPSARAWWMYLDGKEDIGLRRRLSATAHNFAVRGMRKEERVAGVSAGRPRKDREESEPHAPPIGVAAGVFRSLAGDGMGGRIDAPFSRDGNGGLEEAEWPPPVREEAGY